MHLRGASSPLWRLRPFLLLWGGQTVSAIGSQVSNIGLTLLVLALTGSAAQAGGVGAVEGLPYLVLALPAGALVDRWDRKRVMILCDLGRALNLLGIPVALALGRLSLAQLYVTGLIEGTLFVFFTIAEDAALPRVVPAELLPEAIARNEATWAISALAGPPLGGLLFGLRRALPFAADALSYGLSALSLALIPTRFQGERPAEDSAQLWADIVAGLRWLWQRPVLRFVILFSAAGDLLFAAVDLLLIYVARHDLHASAAATGLIFTIAALGGLLGSLLGARVQRRLSLRRALIVPQWIIAVLYPLFLLAPSPFALGAVWAGIAVAVAVSNTVRFSYTAAAIPDELQGRINGLSNLLAYGSLPIGVAMTGVALSVLGSRITILAITGCLVILALTATISPSLRSAVDEATARAGSA